MICVDGSPIICIPMICKSIVMFLSIPCIATLAQTNRLVRAKTRGSMVLRDRVANQLQSYGLGQWFDTMLRESRAIIGGSFVLRAVTCDQWESGDVDMYVSESEGRCGIELIDRYMSSHGGRVIQTAHGQGKSGYVTTHWLYQLDRIRVDLTMVMGKPTNLAKYLVDTYDYDFCMNWYSASELVVARIDSIISRRSVDHHATRAWIPLVTRVLRMDKYRQRGYRVVW